MKQIISFFLFFIMFEAKAQILVFDKSGKDLESIKFGSKAMSYIESNEVSELITLFEKKPNNFEEIKTNLAEIRAQMPMDENTLPAMFKDQVSKNLYYERNFYDQHNEIIVLQIHLKIIRKKNRFFISDIEFRRADRVIRRDKEVKQLESVDNGELDVPPPPPPPR